MKTTAEQPIGTPAPTSGTTAEAAAPTDQSISAAVPESNPHSAVAIREPIFDLLRVPYPHEFSAGARNAVITCLRIQPTEKVTLITDEATLQIAASLAHELEDIGCHWNAFILEAESKTPRPLTAMPASILEDMESSQVSIFAVEIQPNELRSRMQMTDVVNRRRMRHAHMVNITGDIMTQGMTADFAAVDRLSQAVLEKVRAATYLRATTVAGTDIHAQLDPGYRWFKTSGIISAEKWSNLPGGECFTAPGEVNGVFVVDGVVGDYLCKRYGILRANPLTIAIEGNRIARATSSNKDLERDFWNYTHTDARRLERRQNELQAPHFFATPFSRLRMQTYRPRLQDREMLS